MASVLEESNILHVPYESKIDINRNLGAYLLESLENNKNKIGQIDSQTGQSETFGEMLKRSKAFAQALKMKGITTDDIVSLCCYNNMDYMIVIIACTFINVRFCTLDVTADKLETIHCLKLVAPKIIFCHQEHENLIQSSISEAGIQCDIITFENSNNFISVAHFLKEYKSNEKFKIDTTKNLKDTGCIAFTSGTSGFSKGAQCSNFGLYYGALMIIKSVPDIQRLNICTVPYWISNTMFSMASLLGGVTKIIIRSYKSETYVKTIHDFQINFAVFTQHIISDLIKKQDECHYDTSCLKYAYFGGSKIGMNLINQIKQLFPHTKFINAFGMTEGAGLLVYPKQEIIIDENLNCSVGTPLPGMYYKISPAIIENALYLHPDVVECIVISIPHEQDGDLPFAIIKLKANAKTKEQDIIEHIKNHLTDIYHLRGGIKFVDFIPKTTTGKFKRNYLRYII